MSDLNIQESKLTALASFFKNNGVMGIIAVILFYFGNSFDARLTEFNKRLNDISREINDIKIELVQINATYSSKQETRKLIDQAIEKHIVRYHGKELMKPQN